jgi:hypothetical protein
MGLITQKLFDELFFALRGPNLDEAGSVGAMTELEEMVTHDVETIAPIIAKALRDKEEELRKPMTCGHPLIFLTLAPLEEQFALDHIVGQNGRVFVIDAKRAVYYCTECRKKENTHG